MVDPHDGFLTANEFDPFRVRAVTSNYPWASRNARPRLLNSSLSGTTVTLKVCLVFTLMGCIKKVRRDSEPLYAEGVEFNSRGQRPRNKPRMLSTLKGSDLEKQ